MLYHIYKPLAARVYCAGLALLLVLSEVFSSNIQSTLPTFSHLARLALTGGAVVLLEREAKGAALDRAAADFQRAPDKLARMKQGMLSLGIPDATERNYRTVIAQPKSHHTKSPCIGRRKR